MNCMILLCWYWEKYIRQDNRPYWIKKLDKRINRFYVNHFLSPQFKSFGKGSAVFKPRFVKVFGANVSIGNFPTIIGEQDALIQLTSWDVGEWEGEIDIGDYALISPGVRILAAKRVSIGDACMFGHGAYITASDWHGIYDRTEVVGSPKEVVLEKNVWIGDSAIVCKGVTIGENSIIGAGSVVTKDVPKNSVYAGNPAKLVKELDQGEFVSRESFFSDPKKLAEDFDMLDRYTLAKNSTFSWIKSLIFRDKSH